MVHRIQITWRRDTNASIYAASKGYMIKSKSTPLDSDVEAIKSQQRMIGKNKCQRL